MDGNEGDGLAVVRGVRDVRARQAARRRARDAVRRTYACDEMAATAKAAGNFLREPLPERAGEDHPGEHVPEAGLVRGPLEYAHTGIVVDADADTFRSIEGNSNDDGASRAYEVASGVRGYDRMDFILIP